jgi:ABC-type branched-subunit amino acid transport system substrate-binding protein
VGYEVLPAVQVVLDEANAAGELGRYRVALTAINDDLDPATAARQVEVLAQDPSLLAVLGPWTIDTAASAGSSLARTGLPALLAAPLAQAESGNDPAALCPPPGELARELLAQARRLSGGRTVVAGPAGLLYSALQAAGPGAGLQPADVLPPTTVSSGNASPSKAGSDQLAAYRYILYSGDAAAAAGDLLGWRAQGWNGTLLGGPDLAQPWLAGRAGAAAEGTLALACTPGQGSAPGMTEAATARYRAATGSPPGPRALLAYWGAHRLVEALAQDIREHGRPSRSGVAQTLAAQHAPAGVTWLELRAGGWAAR